MSETTQNTEIRWHGRGGQGTVTAAKMFAGAVMHDGKFVQAFPEYGPERMGAPLRAFNRVSAEPLTIHCGVDNPNVVVVVDPKLAQTEQKTIREGAPGDAIFVVNTEKAPAEAREMLGLESQQLWVIDATRIAIETIGRPIPNTVMLGAVVRATGLVGLESLERELEETFGKKFAAKVVDANLEAVKRAYKEVRTDG